MLDKKVIELLNDQVNKEFYSAYLYLDFANFYKDKGLDGFANWYQIQAQEERDHAMLFIQYLQNNNVSVSLEAIAKPDKIIYGNTETRENIREIFDELVKMILEDQGYNAFKIRDSSYPRFKGIQFPVDMKSTNSF